MADEQATTPPATLKGAVLSMNPRITLAFFLVIIAAILIVWLGYILVNKTADAGTAALLAGLVTLIVKMADSSVNYQYQSSAGSDKKDETNATVQKALADKMPAQQNAAPTVVVAWWSLLTDAEKAAIAAAAPTDPRVTAFVKAAEIGKAVADDLTYLAGKGLLTPERAATLKDA